MLLLRFFLSIFGGIFLLCLIALGRQLASEHFSVTARRKTFRGSIEGWILFGAAMVLAVRYVSEFGEAHFMPKIGSGWLLGYGVFCGIYLVVKAVRMIRIHG